MSARFASITLVALVSIAVGCQAPPQFTAQDQTTTQGMFDSTVAWFRVGNWSAWAGQFSEDAVFHPPHAPAAIGRVAIQGWVQQLPPIEQVAFSNVQVKGEGNFAWGTSDYTLQLSGVPGDTGKQLVVFHRDPTAGWQVVAVSFNSDLPLPGAGATQPQ